MLHPLMPFLTEELMAAHSRRQKKTARNRSRSRTIRSTTRKRRIPQAEHEMEILQTIVTTARELRADMKIDPKQIMDGVLVIRECARAMVDEQLAGIEKLAGAKLDVRHSAEGVEGVKRGFPEFDLILRVSAAQAEAQRARIQKEVDQLEKVIASSERQLSDEKFLSRAPAHVVDTIKEKLAGYQAQLQKLRE